MTDQWPGTPVETETPSGFPGTPQEDFSGIDNDPTLSPETKEQLKAALRANPGATGGMSAEGPLEVDIVGDQAPQDDIQVNPSFLDQAKSGIGMGIRSDLRGLANVADLVTLPLSVIYKMLGIELPSYRNLADQGADAMGLDTPQTDTQKLIGALTEGGVGGAATAGIGGVLSGVGGVTGATGRALAATPGADAVAGATGNAAAEEARQAGVGPIGQFAAALAGGGLGGAATQAPGKVASLMPGNRAPTQLAKDAADLGIDLLPADAGGPTTRRLSAAAVQAPLSAGPIVAQGQRIVQQAQAARDAVAKAFGAISTPEAAGEAGRRGAIDYIKNSGKQGGRLYDNAAKLAGDARLQLPNAIAVVDDQIARLREVPGGGEGLGDLEKLRSALERAGGFSVQGIRDMRTEMFVAPELRGTPAERRLRQVVDAASADIEEGLRQQGRSDAAEAFKAADEYWKTRLDTIDNVLQPIIGKDANAKGAEAIYKSINSAAKGNAKQIGRFLNALPEEDAGLVRATLIGRLGLSRPSAQNAEGSGFSLETFLSNWNELTPGAKAVLFPGESREALDKLARVAEASRNAGSYANRSNTAGGIMGQALISGGSGLLGWKSLGATLAGQYGAGRLLASPRFARWLASAPRKPNAAAERAHIGRLAAIAAAEPTIGNEVIRLQDRLMQAFANSPQRVAAEEDQR